MKNLNEKLGLAIKKNKIKDVKDLLETGQVDPNTQYGYVPGFTAFMDAVINGRTGIVKLFLETGKVNFDLRAAERKTALMFACESGHAEIVKILLKNTQVDTALQDEDGNTALILATKEKNLNIVKILLKSGKAHPELQNGKGMTAFMLAAYRGYKEIVKLFLKLGQAYSNLQNRKGYTALMLAIIGYSKEKTDIVGILLDAGEAYPNMQDKNGNTALILASKYGHKRIVGILLETGQSRPLLEDRDGKTALDHAIEPEIKELIRQHMSSIKSKARRGILSKTRSDREKFSPLPVLDPLKLCRPPSSPEKTRALEEWYKLYEPNPKEKLSHREMCAALARLYKEYGHRKWSTIALCQRPLSEWSPERFIWLISYAHYLKVKPHILVEKYPGGPQELSEKRGEKYFENAMPVVLKYYCVKLRRKLHKEISEEQK